MQPQYLSKKAHEFDDLPEPVPGIFENFTWNFLVPTLGMLLAMLIAVVGTTPSSSTIWGSAYANRRPLLLFAGAVLSYQWIVTIVILKLRQPGSRLNRLKYYLIGSFHLAIKRRH